MNRRICLETEILFGEGVVKEFLAKMLEKHNAKNVLLLYGGGSIKKNNNIFDNVKKIVESCGLNFFEFGGIEPNPKDKTIDLAVEESRKNNIDLIIAAGGGSVIDASKVLAVMITNENMKSSWDYVLSGGKTSKPACKIFSIITLAATGSENNYGSVVTNSETKMKRAVFTPTGKPIVCFEDPTYTYSVSKYQTACGTFDIISHILEQLYSTKPFEWIQNYLIANLKTVLKYARIAYWDPTNYEARANILFASSWSLNDLSHVNAAYEDWNVHSIEHGISGLWDVAHGAGLALVTPTYIKHCCEENKQFKDISLIIAKEVFKVNTIDEYLIALTNLIDDLNLPIKFTDFDEIKFVNESHLKFLIDHCNKDEKDEQRKKIKNEVIKKLFDECDK